RNEMGQLEDEGYLEQPHISAGRIPTALGYRMYVREQMKPNSQEALVRKRFATLKDQYLMKKDQEKAYEAVSLLTHMIPNIAFATVPHKERVYYLGLSNVLKQPEIQADPVMASGIAEVLEDHLTTMLEKIEVDDQVRYYIGEENILEQIHSCSLMVTNYQMRDFEGVIGILGPMRMDYGYNTVALDLITDMMKSA
ncbi:MAG: hypothetical protein HN735_02125, partial [Candidatus Peribacter sp.]|nr:hypothetical protein [Candidatus Peribacter sp.]